MTSKTDKVLPKSHPINTILSSRIKPSEKNKPSENKAPRKPHNSPIERKPPSVQVYWLHIASHTDPYTEGYIGVSKNPEKRLLEHIKKAQKPKNGLHKYLKAGAKVKMEILYRGLEDECYRLEKKYRPDWNIGWNIAPGGKDNWEFYDRNNKLKFRLLQRKGNGKNPKESTSYPQVDEI